MHELWPHEIYLHADLSACKDVDSAKGNTETKPGRSWISRRNRLRILTRRFPALPTRINAAGYLS